MNKQDMSYFPALTKDRAETAAAMQKRSVRGIWNSVVDKYSDQAHFLYELLQNADDAQASSARFILKDDKLIFAHNGTRHFSITNPNQEDADTDSGNLGDINAITSVANSNKTEASIGKFGVGFKAVFQYTSTPHIYDPNYRFKIENFIVPIEINHDYPERRKNETLFVLPFDHPNKSKKDAYADISDKLKKLSYPLLFLTNLKEIEYVFEDKIGLYGKSVKKSYDFEGTTVEQICLTQNDDNDDIYDENIWLFSRLDEEERRYSVGFFTDLDGKLKPVNKPAFCFFPTRENTGLNFIVHAPFLLTDSREGIRAGIIHNNTMIDKLSSLAADSLELFKEIGDKEKIRIIDDNIIKIIPVNPQNFSDPFDKSSVSFLPFYNKIKEKFQNSALLPSTDGYACPKNAYWASIKRLPDLFSNMQLSEIVVNKDAKWVFPSISREEIQDTNRPLLSYIDSLIRTSINEDNILSGRKKTYIPIGGKLTEVEYIKGIDKYFIETQRIEWLHQFYKWISETKHRKDISKTIPIFLDQNKKASSAFDSDNQSILFLPVNGIWGYTTIHSELLNNKDTLQFIQDIGIKEPSLRDQIYNKILPLYANDGEIDTMPHFKMFFDYYCQCPNQEINDYINLIKDCEFLAYYDNETDDFYRVKAESLYIPNDNLKAYFETKNNTNFIALDKYIELVGVKNKDKLLSFLSSLGVKEEIEIAKNYLTIYEALERKLPTPRSTKTTSYEEPFIDGCKEIIEYILENKNEEKSRLLWENLLRIIEKYCSSYQNLNSILRGIINYFYYTPQKMYFTSFDANLLKESAWLKDINGEFCAPSELSLETLSPIYDISSPFAVKLIEFLGISQTQISNDIINIENYDDLTEEQQNKIKLAEKLIKNGFTEEDVDEFIEYQKQKKLIAIEKQSFENHHNTKDQASVTDFVNVDEELEEDSLQINFDEENADNNISHTFSDKKSINKATKNVILDIVHRTKIKTDGILPTVTDDSDDFDDDELMPSPVDYSKKIERAKEKSAAEISKITYYENLYNNAVKLNQQAKYSVGWFKALLELESLKSNEDNAYSKEVSISFAKVEREIDTQRTLILKHPNRYIPKFIEDLADIPLILHMGDTKKTIPIEVMSIKSYTLRVKVKSSADIEGVNLDAVTSATIEAQNPSFLLKELKDQFNKLELEDGFNMRDNLCKNIEFIFGPPGTGKTTYIAQNVILPLMEEKNDCKILVLTPTNKAADVLAKRIMEASGKDKSYENWLLRFGGTGDENIEKNPIFKDKTFDITKLNKNVTVSTIARFPYDFFMPQGKRIFLHGINWDYIIIDEASMIPITNIVFPLYKKTPKKFIIAGDPFQIEPITAIDLWKNENIYTMVGLDSTDSFSNPQTIPHQYKVELLTTQYRSIPAIGDIFSKLTYGGKLRHSRIPESQRPLNVGNDLGVETLNIIKYPVSKYESIYRPKRLQHNSSYQVYSALFVFEYVCYLSRAIANNNPKKTFKIGIIAPYRAQADMIDKLFASEKSPPEVDVQVGTIHGFQGDECDIIFAVFNTPPSISNSKEMFLNKLNIINVSISRAKDYLFIVMPDDDTEGVSNLRLIKRVERLMQNTDDWNEFLSPDLEDLIFDDPAYLEKNAFSTSHQNVNVYGLPESRYEIRTEDNAVDVQIHRNAIINIKEQDKILAKDNENYLNANEIFVSKSNISTGKYTLIQYLGKLKNINKKHCVQMFIPLMKNGNEKLIPVSVFENERKIYIPENFYECYRKEFESLKRIELRKNIDST